MSKSLKNKKIIFFHDYLDDHSTELNTIVHNLKNFDFEIDKDDIEKVLTPPLNKKFDILFFDYGGVSIGNSILHSFCKNIFYMAEEYPNRDFIMQSNFTREAMSDILRENDKILPNIFLDIDTWYQYRKNEF